MTPKAYPEKHSKNIFTRGKKIFILLVACMFLFSLNFVIAAEDESGRALSEDKVCMSKCMINSGLTPGKDCGPGTPDGPECDECSNKCFNFERTDFEDEEFMTDWDGTCGDMDCDEIEIVGAGITPDSPFYFIDELFDNFGDEIGNREERVAEIKSMIEAGDYEAAHKALIKYKEYAKKLEEESDPDKREESRRSAAAIKNALDEIKDDIPEERKDDFYDDIIEKEKELLTAVDISSKIKELCVQLADLDPIQYAKTCKSGDDAPKWKKDLDKDLTEEQREEAKNFGNIMSQCFETSGRNCACEDISFYDFSLACSKIAPLAVECDEGSETACREMDEIEMPRLPDHLEDVLEDIEDKYSEDKYDMHMPSECIEAGVTNPRECGRIMIKENAPVECRQALLAADVQNEREGRKICDKIMFKLHAPKECIDEGITDPEECKDMMDNYRGPEGPRGPNDMGPPGQNCMGIQDKMERLDCFEGAVGNMGNHYGIGEKYTGNEGDVTWQCKENRIHWPPDCEVFMREEWPEQERMRNEEQHKEWEQKDDWRVMEKKCANNCEGDGKPWSFYNGVCRCGDPGSYADGQGGFYREEDSKSDEWNGYDCSVMYCGDNSHCEPDMGCVSDGGDDKYNDKTEEHVVETDYDEGTSSGGEASNVVETTTSSDGGSSEPVVDNVVEDIIGVVDDVVDEPSQDEPVQDEPSQDEPVQDEPAGDTTLTGEVVRNKFLDYYN